MHVRARRVVPASPHESRNRSTPHSARFAVRRTSSPPHERTSGRPSTAVRLQAVSPSQTQPATPHSTHRDTRSPTRPHALPPGHQPESAHRKTPTDSARREPTAIPCPRDVNASRYALNRALNCRSARSISSPSTLWSFCIRWSSARKHLGRRAIVQRVALRDEDSQRSTEISQLPLRMIGVPTRRDGRQPVDVRRASAPASAQPRTPRSVAAARDRRGRNGKGARAPVRQPCRTGSARRPDADTAGAGASPTRSRTCALLHAAGRSTARCRAPRRSCAAAGPTRGGCCSRATTAHRSASTGWVTQCTSNVECSDAEMTSRTVISSRRRARR